ncbi:MAG: histone deacetylase, partial [Deltaproteobacteria bacterium]|nr:histone deacetylase [Deltaproteobacteria bacterium]
NKNSYQIALLSAGGAIAGADAVTSGKADRAFCAVRPPGHHAARDEGMGFCLLNNAAITVRALQESHGISRVMVIDWDVHHGNGTQSIFWEDPSVFFFSIHENPAFLYPGTGRQWETGRGAGEGTTLNAPMPPGAGDDEYRLAFEQTLAPAAERFRPEFLVLSAGFDAHRDDPLADLELTEEGFRFLSRFAVDLANRYCGGRIVSILEGGYERESLTRCTEIHIRELQQD